MTRYEQGFLNKCAEYGIDTGTTTGLLGMTKHAGLLNPLFGVLRSKAGRQALYNTIRQSAARYYNGGMNSRFMQLLSGRNVRGVENLFLKGRTGEEGRMIINNLRRYGRAANNSLWRKARDASGALTREGLDKVRTTSKRDFANMQRVLRDGSLPKVTNGNDFFAKLNTISRAYNAERAKVLGTRLGVGGAALGTAGLMGRATNSDIEDPQY